MEHRAEVRGQRSEGRGQKTEKKHRGKVLNLEIKGNA